MPQPLSGGGVTFNRVSVLVPTRRRVARLQRLLDSWHATVTDPASAELLFRIDDDDQESKQFLQDYPHCVLTGPRLQGYRSLPQFFEQLRLKANGQLYLTGNDDMIFRTPNWPQLVCDVANQYPDGIFCLGVDVYNAKNFPFAIVSKKATDLIGYIHDSRLFWGDVFLRDVYATFGRAIRFNTVRIDHEWAGHQPDQTFVDAHQEEFAHWGNGYRERHLQCVHEAAAKLSAALVAV